MSSPFHHPPLGVDVQMKQALHGCPKCRPSWRRHGGAVAVGLTSPGTEKNHTKQTIDFLLTSCLYINLARKPSSLRRSEKWMLSILQSKTVAVIWLFKALIAMVHGPILWLFRFMFFFWHKAMHKERMFSEILGSGKCQNRWAGPEVSWCWWNEWRNPFDMENIPCFIALGLVYVYIHIPAIIQPAQIEDSFHQECY